MPKLKTHSGAKKRMSITKTGKVQRRHASNGHNLSKKSASRKRTFAGVESLIGRNRQNIKLKLGV
jgi:large subunit ribosomal protein L35